MTSGGQNISMPSNGDPFTRSTAAESAHVRHEGAARVGEFRRTAVLVRWLGARLLDAAVPAAGVPCGVALDAGGPGALFPPVAGIVPDRVAVDVTEAWGDTK
ncbi:hypothetical protein [Streptomyces sp. LaBMicrA B280]|uniref:hypothetical protein n=1 Tax=Streptomyces sp. LaBMicrA B280 TaxID=3391001 RepID=UPI003BA6BAA3